MVSQIVASVENNFTKGLLTEYTGLNFPPNAATDCDNVEFSIIGDVERREGIDYELNSVSYNVDKTNAAMNTYKWNNAGGDGLTQIIVVQVKSILYFYRSSAATVDVPASANRLLTTIDFSIYRTVGSIVDVGAVECQFTDGNGYLFVFHPNCEPFFCTYNNLTLQSAAITVKVRDFTGTDEGGVAFDTRPLTLTPEHQYNLYNQGWTNAIPYNFNTSTFNTVGLGSKSFTVSAGAAVILGDQVNILNANDDTVNGVYQKSGTIVMSGTITGYVGTVLTVNVTYQNPIWTGVVYSPWVIITANVGYINTWQAAVGNYPSNADVWWYFKDNTDTFNPSVTLNKVSFGGPAPKGHYIIDAFSQQRSIVSSIVGLTSVTTTIRPRTGTWFQGRVWFTGVDDSFASSGDQLFSSWTESIYFSQVVETQKDFGKCYQANDPTSEQLFDLLPTDGGVIRIQGCGSIYKLFPIQNGLLVFAGNGVWFITGSRGIGFAANDYTVTQLSQVRSISGTSFVNVNGLPYFWNEEGIYSVQPTQGGGLTVEPITVSTILSFYSEIPVSSKQFVRGAYDPVNYIIQWIYNGNDAETVQDRYTFDKILNYNTFNKAFFPYTVDTSTKAINGIVYVVSPGGSSAPAPMIKFLAGSTNDITFADFHDENFVDWGNVNYTSFFISGFRLQGQGQRKFQMPYILMYSNALEPTSYKIQGVWDYAATPESGKWSTAQLVNNWSPNFSAIFRRHRIRGNGTVLQLKVTSVDGMPFSVFGWSVLETQNTGV